MTLPWASNVPRKEDNVEGVDEMMSWKARVSERELRSWLQAGFIKVSMCFHCFFFSPRESKLSRLECLNLFIANPTGDDKPHCFRRIQF